MVSITLWHLPYGLFISLLIRKDDFLVRLSSILDVLAEVLNFFSFSKDSIKQGTVLVLSEFYFSLKILI